MRHVAAVAAFLGDPIPSCRNNIIDPWSAGKSDAVMSRRLTGTTRTLKWRNDLAMEFAENARQG